MKGCLISIFTFLRRGQCGKKAKRKSGICCNDRHSMQKGNQHDMMLLPNTALPGDLKPTVLKSSSLTNNCFKYHNNYFHLELSCLHKKECVCFRGCCLSLFFVTHTHTNTHTRARTHTRTHTHTHTQTKKQLVHQYN